MVTRLPVLPCTALWRAVNLWHTVALFCTRGIWNTQSVTHSLLWSHRGYCSVDGIFMMFVSCRLSLEELTSVTPTHTHTVPLSTPDHPSLSILLSLFAKYCLLPVSQQGPAAIGHARHQPSSSSERSWRHRSAPRWFCDAHQYVLAPIAYISSDQQLSVDRARFAQKHARAPLFLFERLRQRWRNRDANDEYLADSRMKRGLLLLPTYTHCCYSNPQHCSKAGLFVHSSQSLHHQTKSSHTYFFGWHRISNTHLD